MSHLDPRQQLRAAILKYSKSAIFGRLFAGSFWTAVSTVYVKGASLVSTVVVTRLIGRDALGELGMLATTIAMFGLFTSFGTSQAATKYIAEYRTSNREKTGRIIGLSLLFSAALGVAIFLLVALLANALATQSLRAPHLADSLRLMALGMLFGSMNGALSGVITGFEAFRAGALVSVFSGTASTIAKISLAYSYGFQGAVVGMTVEPFFAFVTTYLPAQRIIRANRIRVRFKGALEESRALLHYGVPATLTGLLYFPANWYSMTLLARSAGGYYELGAYNAANQWYNTLIFLPYILVSAFLPVLSDLLARGATQTVKTILNSAILLALAMFIPLTLVFLVFGETIAQIYGPEFKGTGFLLAVSVFTLVPQALSIIISNLVAGLNRMWFTFWVNAAWCVIFVGATYALLPMGALGLLWARLLAFSANLMFMMFFFHKWKSAVQV